MLQVDHSVVMSAAPNANRRPTIAEARAVIESWLDEHVPDYPTYSLCEDGDGGWAFWIVPDDTTSYVRDDLSIQWLGTGWPEQWVYEGDTGRWHEVTANH